MVAGYQEISTALKNRLELVEVTNSPMYKDLIVNNRSFLKRFSHSRRFVVAVKLLDVRQSDEILDIGTGDGYMLHKIVAAGAFSTTLPFSMTTMRSQ